MIAAAALAAAFTCHATHVHDGDGPIHCAEGPKIRLEGIAAKEIDETCRANQPCPRASAQAAKRELERLVLGRVLTCQATGRSYQRVVARCWVGGVSVECAMIASGTVLRWAAYDRQGRLRRCR